MVHSKVCNVIFNLFTKVFTVWFLRKRSRDTYDEGT